MALSLFSGCGGDTLGIEKCKIPVKFYSEIKKDFQESHELNFPKSKLLGGDITKIPDENFEKLKGKIAIIFAGFPCQSFSQGGKKDPDDPRGQLFIEFVRATRLIQPEVIIGENVKGLLSRKTKKGENFLDIIIQSFLEIGYHCQFKVFKCDEFGIPQKRERLIIIGKKNKPFVRKFNLDKFKVSSKSTIKNIISFDMTGAIKVPKELLDEAGVPSNKIITNLENDEEEDEVVHPYLRLYAGKRDIEHNGKYISKFCFSFGKRISPIHCEIVDVDEPSKTIICTYDHQPRMFVPLRNKNGYFLRPYTVDELKEIQGFPRNYKLSGNLKAQTVQLGNAVPPPLIQKVIQWIFF